MDSNKNRPILNIDDHEYYIDSLPDEGKGLVNGLRTADAQLKMYEDTLKMINIGKVKMLEDLKKILRNIDPIERWIIGDLKLIVKTNLYLFQLIWI